MSPLKEKGRGAGGEEAGNEELEGGKHSEIGWGCQGSCASSVCRCWEKGRQLIQRHVSGGAGSKI